MRLSSLSKSLAGTHRFSLALPFPFSRSQPPRCSLSPLWRERILDDEFPAISIAFDCDCFLNLSPRSVLRDPFSSPLSLLFLIASEFFAIPTPSVENRRMQFLSRVYGEPFLSPSRVRSSPFFPRLSPTIRRHHTCRRHLNARSSLRQSIFSHALHPPRSDLVSQNNYRSRRTNDIFQDNVYEGCTMEICMYIFFIQILIYSSTAEAETTLILQYKFTNFVG